MKRRSNGVTTNTDIENKIVYSVERYWENKPKYKSNPKQLFFLCTSFNAPKYFIMTFSKKPRKNIIVLYLTLTFGHFHKCYHSSAIYTSCFCKLLLFVWSAVPTQVEYLRFLRTVAFNHRSSSLEQVFQSYSFHNPH